MRRALTLTLFGIVLATGAWADAPQETPLEEARLHENMDLVKNLVKGSLLLAGEDDPLKRADHCNALATYVASEMEQSAEKRNTDRVAELGHHLQALFQQGVAANIDILRQEIPAGSARAQEMDRLAQNIRQVLDTLESHLRECGENDEGIQHALQAIRDARAEVEKALEKRQGKKHG